MVANINTIDRSCTNINRKKGSRQKASAVLAELKKWRKILALWEEEIAELLHKKKISKNTSQWMKTAIWRIFARVKTLLKTWNIRGTGRSSYEDGKNYMDLADLNTPRSAFLHKGALRARKDCHYRSNRLQYFSERTSQFIIFSYLLLLLFFNCS